MLARWVAPVPVSAQSLSGAAVAFTAPLGAMAEAAIAVDPTNSRHLIAAADPYGGALRVRLATSADAGVTWSPPQNLIPPGFAKSYDPVVFVSRSGAVVVVGGASGVGRPNCQTGSAIFIAVVNGGAVTYQVIRDARADGAYVDRPGFVLSPVEDLAYVTWTESTGPGAACRGTPVRSTVMLATGPPSGPFSSPIRLPTSGLPGPFGATPGIAADGSLLVAVGEHGPAQRSRLTVTTSTDRGHSFSPSKIVFDGASPPNRVSGVSGFVAAVPSIAVDRSGRIAIAFGQTLPGTGAGAVVVERTEDMVWQTITPPAQGTVELLPQVVYDHQGTLWMVSARVAGGFIDLALRRRSSAWEAPISLARGSSAKYSEVGESLGLVATDDAVIAGAPINRTGDSAMVVASHRIPPPDPPPTTTTMTTTPTSTTASTTSAATKAVPPRPSHGPPFRAAAPLLIAAGVGVAALALSLAVLRRGRTRGP